MQSLKIYIWQESVKKNPFRLLWNGGGKTHFFNSKKSTLAFIGFYNSEAAEMLKLSSWQDRNWNLQSRFNLTRVGALHFRGFWWVCEPEPSAQCGHPHPHCVWVLVSVPPSAELTVSLGPQSLSHYSWSCWCHSTVLKVLGYWARPPGFAVLLLLPVNVGSYSSSLISLCLSSLILKWGSYLRGFLWGWVKSWKCLRTVPRT